MKEIRYEKVVEWGGLNKNQLNGKDLVIEGLMVMIPILNILFGIALIFAGLTYRRVYWRRC